MKRVLFLLGLLVYMASALAQQNRWDSETNKVLVVSHRGDWRNTPENSLRAIQNCIDMGVDMVEIDLKKTKDGELVLMHDNRIDRTMTGSGTPGQYTLTELKSMRLKNGAGVPTRHQIPTLREAMMMAKGQILVNIDKGYDYFKETFEILKETGTTGQVIIKSGLPYDEVMKEYGALLDKVEFMPIVNANSPEALSFVSDYLKEPRVKAFELTFKEDIPQVRELIHSIHSAGKQVWINTLWPSLCAGMDDDRAVELDEKEESWGKVLEMGVRYIQTDRPKELIEYLKRKGYK